MAHSSCPVSGFIRFASSRITLRANLWLVSKIIWIAFDGAYQVVDHTQLLFEQASIICPLVHRLGGKVITFGGSARPRFHPSSMWKIRRAPQEWPSEKKLDILCPCGNADTVGEPSKQRTYAFYPIEFKELTRLRLNSTTASGAPKAHHL
jgi:hypothetical protein